MTSRLLPRCAALWAAFAVLVGTLVPSAPALAQSSSDTGIVNITVRDAAAAAALQDARVFLLGPVTASALTTKSGIVKYTDVPAGIYRVRVNKNGFTAVISNAFEVLGNKQVDVEVDLGVRQQASAPTTSTSDTSGLRVIGSTRARVTVTTTDVDENSAVRRISDSLTDALGKIAGVDVTQDSNDPNAAQTISLRGRDESQTAVTLDGIPLAAPGAAANLRSIGTDLFRGAGVNFGAQAGSLGGSVNFRTLQPTQTWQSVLAASYGTFDRYNYQIGETGSLGKLGIAVLHSKRGGNNPLTFQTYLDQSGFDYAHGGESANAGDFLKLRYGLGDKTTLNLTALQNQSANSSLCTQFVAPQPCGSGPGNGSSGSFRFGYLTAQTLVGDTALNLTGYVNDNRSFNDSLHRYVYNAFTNTSVLRPFSSENNSLARGLAGSATITKARHTITLSGSTYASITTFNPLVGGSVFVAPATSSSASRSVQLGDSFKVSDKLTIGPTLSYAGTSGAGSSILGGLSGSWRPTGSDSYNASVSFGSSQPANGLLRTYSDPLSARVNCFAGSAIVNGPGDQPSHQSAANYDLSWTHSWSKGQFTTNFYRQTQSGQLFNATVTAASLGVDPAYLAQVGGYYSNVCATPAAPAVYVQSQLGGTTRQYQGFDLTARLGFGPNVVVIPSYSSTGATVTAADPKYLGLDSTLILNGQIPGRPMHRGNLTIDVNLPHSGLEFLTNAQYVGPNNGQRLAPYVLVNAGVSRTVGPGRLTVFASNIFNTEAGAFSTLQYAQPIPLSGGGSLLQAANPNTPRQYTVSYSFNTGSRPGAGFSRGASGRGGAAATAATPRANFGFGQLKFIAPPAGVDPLSVATARPECTADLKPTAETDLASLKGAFAAYASTGTLPEVPNLTLTPAGDPKGVWWVGVGPKIDPAIFAALGRNAGGGPRQGGFGGGNSEGGAPITGPTVIVGPGSTGPARADATPPPELIKALLPLRALAACAYATVLTPAEAKAKGLDVQPGARVVAGGPGASPSPSPAAAVAGATPAPRPSGSPVPGGRRGGGGGAVYYTPSLGFFVVRAPDLGSGGGSVKQ